MTVPNEPIPPLDEWLRVTQTINKIRNRGRHLMEIAREAEYQLMLLTVRHEANLNRIDKLVSDLNAHEPLRGQAHEKVGYERAIAILRDDARYEQWYTAMKADHPEYGYWNSGRIHLADYLEFIWQEDDTRA